jgi:hypothetical protein
VGDLRHGVQDPELVELFADDPGGLAIVDAIAVSQRSASRHKPVRLVAIAAVLILLAVTVGLLSGTSRAGVIEKAINALPYERVIYLRVETAKPGASTIDLRTGRATVASQAISEWYDPRDGIYRVRDELNGVVVSDTRGRRSNSPTATFTTVRLTKFLDAYRSLLARAKNHDVTRGRIGDQAIYRIPFAGSNSFASVAISVRTFKPVEIVLRDGGHLRRLRVVQAGSLPPSHIVPPAQPLPPLSSNSAPVARQRVGIVAARRAGLVTSLPAGVTNKLKLLSIWLVRFKSSESAGEFVYGKRQPANGGFPQDFLRVQESARPERYFGWSRATTELVANGRTLYVERDGQIWTVFERQAGRYFRLMSSAPRALVVRAAVALGAR